MSWCINPRCQNPENPDELKSCQACGTELLLLSLYQVIRQIGSDRFGNTYEIDQTGNRQILKTIDLNHIPLDSQSKVLSQFQQEVKVLMELNSPGFPKAERTFEFFPNNSQTPLHCLVLQKIEGVELQDYLIQQNRQVIPEEFVVAWLTQLISIIEQVPELRPLNIQLSQIICQPNGQLVLVPWLSLAKFDHPEQTELVPQSDLVALGHTFIYLLTGKDPTDPKLYNLNNNLNNNELSWRHDAPNLSPILADLIDELIAAKPDCTAQKILQQLAEINQALHQTKTPIPLPPLPAISPAELPWQHAELAVTLKGHIWPVFALAMSSDSQILASSSSDCTIKLWSLKNGEQLCTLGKYGWFFGMIGTWVNSLAFTPKSEVSPEKPLLLATGNSDHTIKLWNCNIRQPILNLRGHVDWVNSVAFSPDGQIIASASADQTIKLWDLSQDRIAQALAQPTRDRSADHSGNPLLNTLKGHSLAVMCVAISPDGKILASGSDKEIKLWNLISHEEIRTLTGHEGWVHSVVFSPDGQTLASGSQDNTIKVWDLNTGDQVFSLTRHSSWVYAVAFSPDGHLLASGGRDKTIKLWNLNNGEEICTLTGHSDWVNAVVFSPDGRILASGSTDKTIKIWRSS